MSRQERGVVENLDEGLELDSGWNLGDRTHDARRQLPRADRHEHARAAYRRHHAFGNVVGEEAEKWNGNGYEDGHSECTMQNARCTLQGPARCSVVVQFTLNGAT